MLHPTKVLYHSSSLVDRSQAVSPTSRGTASSPACLCWPESATRTHHLRCPQLLWPRLLGSRLSKAWNLLSRATATCFSWSWCSRSKSHQYWGPSFHFPVIPAASSQTTAATPGSSPSCRGKGSSWSSWTLGPTSSSSLSKSGSLLHLCQSFVTNHV